jgi:hypothetical protein
MEYDLMIRYPQSMMLRYELEPFGFWRKLGYRLGLVSPGNVLAEVESGIRAQDGMGEICCIDMHRYPEPGKMVYKGFGRVVSGRAILRIMVDDSVRNGYWIWSFEFSTLDN